MQQSGAHLNHHDINVAEERIPAQLEELPQDFKLEGRDCVVLACVSLGGIDLHSTCTSCAMQPRVGDGWAAELDTGV